MNLTLHEASALAGASLASTYGLAWATRPRGDGAVRLARTVSTRAAVSGFIAAGLIALSLGPAPGCLLIGTMYFAVRLLKAWFESRLGGVTTGGLAAGLVILSSAGFLALTALGTPVLK